ncbi:hypothetical protein [Nocardia sp. NPDC058497]|uniref:hypothetical protein n=1 Tax=Nocardia sp. NPDC058497 TaxID=3346529 RepID=UPI00364AD7BA
MFSRKILVAAGAVSAAALFFGPVTVASAATGSAGLASGSAGSSSGSAGSSSGSAMLESGSSALDSGTSAIVNIIEAISGVKALNQPQPAA